jgi:glucose/arabinose dehydrogenase
MSPRAVFAALLGAAALSACAGQAVLQQADARGYAPGFGPNPVLPAPEHALIPTVDIAPADPWPQGAHPIPAAGLAASAYASGLDHPRWLYVLPNGDVLVAESNKPDNAPKERGIRARIQSVMQKRAGAGVASPNRIVLLRGVAANGTAATRTVFMQGLNSPFGMALAGKYLYIANADALMRFPYQAGDTSISAQGEKVMDLPSGINHHWTKNVAASPDGSKLYVTVGSNSNAAENGMDAEEGRAAIWEYDIASGKSRIFASGLRNPNGLAFQPQTRALWVAVNERDELGNELVPDYMTKVEDGAFYGWPYSYYGQHVDTRVTPPRPDMVARAIPPDYALGAHTASLGLAFYDADLMPQFKNGALVGQHGSWNRKPQAGYKLIYVPFTNGKPSGPPQDVLTGFLSRDGKANGRPVGVAVDKQGAILLADDVGNVVWRITPAVASTAMATK